MPVGPRSAARLHSMHKDITRPPPSKTLGEYENDLDRWEGDLEEYYRCGGEVMGVKTKVLTAKDMLPSDTDAAVHLAVKNDIDDYDSYRKNIRESIQYLTDHGVIGRRRGGAAQALEEDPSGMYPSGIAQEAPSSAWELVPTAEDFPRGTFASEEAKENYVLVMSRFAQARQ